MGIGGISPVQLIIILVIVILIFGTKKLKNLGGDLGGAIRNFKKSVKEEDPEELEDNAETDGEAVVDADAQKEEVGEDSKKES